MKEFNPNKLNVDGYRSPARKLVTFFKRSRDKWKSKCQQGKYQIKLLKKRLLYMQKRRTELKSRIAELETEVKNAQIREKVLIEEINQLKKTHH